MVTRTRGAAKPKIPLLSVFAKPFARSAEPSGVQRAACSVHLPDILSLGHMAGEI